MNTITHVAGQEAGPHRTRRRQEREGRSIIVGAILTVGFLAALAWGWNAVTAPVDLLSGTAETGRLEPAFIEAAELQRLIAAYQERTESHTDALDFRILGSLYLERGRQDGNVATFDSAQRAFERAAELFPSDAESRIGLASVAYATHDFERSLELAVGIVAQLPGRQDARLLVADSLVALGRHAEAEPVVAIVESVLGSDRPEILVRRSTLARLDGDPETAIELATRAVELTPARPLSRLAWYQTFAAQTAFDLGDRDKAVVLAEAALAVDDTPATLVTAARVAAGEGRLQNALDLYRRAIEARPDPGFFAELGDVASALGDPDAAADAYAVVDDAARLAEAGGLYDRVLAMSLASRGVDVERAIELASRDADLRGDPAAWDTLAWALRAAGKTERAREASDRARASGVVDARIVYHAAMISLDLGETERARRELREALDINPNFHPLESQVAARTLEALS